MTDQENTEIVLTDEELEQIKVQTVKDLAACSIAWAEILHSAGWLTGQTYTEIVRFHDRPVAGDTGPEAS